MKTVGNRDDYTSAPDVVRIKEYNKPYWHKPIDGPKMVHTVFYPTMGDEGKVRTMAVTVRDPFKNTFSPIIDMDRSIKKKEVLARGGDVATANKVRSSLSANTTYHCLILDKKDDVPVVKHAEYPYSVYKKLVDSERQFAIDEKGNQDESKLRYGLLFMNWYEITRIEKGTSKDKQYNTDYTVTVMTKYVGVWENRVKAALLHKDCWQEINEAKKEIIVHTATKDYPFPVVEMGMMSELEFQAMINYEHQLSDLIIPMTDEQAIEKLQSYPIMLDARDSSGNYYLPNWEEMKEHLQDMDDLPFVLSSAPKKMISAPANSVFDDDEDLPDELPEKVEKDEVEEVEAEVIEEPAKKRGRPAKSVEALFDDEPEKEAKEIKGESKKTEFDSLF